MFDLSVTVKLPLTSCGADGNCTITRLSAFNGRQSLVTVFAYTAVTVTAIIKVNILFIFYKITEKYFNVEITGLCCTLYIHQKLNRYIYFHAPPRKKPLDSQC